MSEGHGATRPARSEHAHHWNLDAGVTFLNHGSFGACPAPVLEVQESYRRRMEAEPVQFLHRDLEELLDEARGRLAEFVGADPEDLAFVPNATTGVNAVLRSLPFEPGDELLTTSHEYNACRNVLEFVAGRSGAKVVVAEIPFPVASPDEIVSAVLGRVTPRTRLALFDHITSPTGLVMPAARLAAGLSERGVDTLIDGAHAPGMLPLDLSALGATYYTGNCHKWLCAPKGAALLYVRRDRQPRIRPLALSHGANSRRTDRSRFRLEFSWTGTFDPSACLAVPAAIDFLGTLLPGGWETLRERNRALALEARATISERLGLDAACPEEMVGALASLPLARGPYRFRTTALEFHPLDDALRERYGIEVPVFACPDGPGPLLRVSAQIYNTPAEYALLAAAMLDLESVWRETPRPRSMRAT